MSSFRLLVDRVLPCALELARWCPTMDLLVYSNEKGELFVQRAGSGDSWARLLQLNGSSEEKPTAARWRVPDGT